MSKRLLTIIICAGCFVVLLVSYVVFVRPLLTGEPAEEDDPPELLEGEVLGVNNRIMMFEHVEKADMYSIEVHNNIGTYRFYRGKNDEFCIEGMEACPFNLEMFSSLVVSTGYTISLRRLDFEEVDSDLSVYGLSENDDYSWFTVTKMDGRTHTVKVGNLIPTGGGYYCMYEGRNAVYVLDSTLVATVLADIHKFITPVLGWPVSSSDYYKVDDFQLFKNGSVYVWIDMLTAEETGSEDGLPDFKLKYPLGYELNLSSYSTNLETFAEFVGDSTIAAGKELEDVDEAMLLEQYGIDVASPYFMVHYKADDIETVVIFSEPDKNGSVYAYSTLYNIVAKFDNVYSSESKGNFITWGLLKYISNSVYSTNINDVSKIEISGNNGSGTIVNEYFDLDGEGETILVTENGNGNPYRADDLKNFRQLYKSMLQIKLQDYVDEGYEKNLNQIAEMKVTLDNGDVYDYLFYSYTTRRCFYTVNGVGEFYCLREQVEKLISDTARMINGEQIVSDNKQ